MTKTEEAVREVARCRVELEVKEAACKIAESEASDARVEEHAARTAYSNAWGALEALVAEVKP